MGRSLSFPLHQVFFHLVPFPYLIKVGMDGTRALFITHFIFIFYIFYFYFYILCLQLVNIITFSLLHFFPLMLSLKMMISFLFLFDKNLKFGINFKWDGQWGKTMFYRTHHVPTLGNDPHSIYSVRRAIFADIQ